VLDAADGSVEDVWSQAFGTIMGISAGESAQGNPIILVSESSSSSIEVYTPAGGFIRSVGSGPGTGACQLNEVRDAATDGDGNIYAADYKNNRMVKFDPTGTICQPFSGTGTGPGQLKRPYGVDLDRLDRVYVADGNDRIQKFAADGTFLGDIYGERGTGPAKFSMLRRVAVGHWNSPKVCGADLWTYKIECFSQNRAYLRSYPQPVAGPATGFFNEPYGVSVDSKIFVMDTTNQRVQRLSGSGAFELTWGERGWGEGNPGFNWARDLTTLGGSSGTIWVADTKNSRLLEFTRNGVPTGRVRGKLGSALGDLNWPFAVSAYGDDLIVADTKNHRIQRWDPDAALPMWTAGGFANPKDVTVDGDTVYVADSDNKRIVRLDVADGSFINAFGQPTLHRVEGVAVEPNGDVWVSDTSWNRLVEFSSAGAFLQKFGAVGSTHGKFNQPAHLQILPGNPVRLYVADQWNDRIEIFTVT
jgi:tripartite motif-containing protein 71